jgi:SAM-dependent methyltransferase
VQTFSTGHGGSFLDRTRSLFRHYRRNRRFAEWDFKLIRLSGAALEKHGERPLEGARVLDLGCGQRFPATLLFHTFGARATGIDTDVVDPRAGWLRILRENGLERFAKTAVRRALFDRDYYRELERLAGRPLRFDGLDLRLMDARAFDFPDGEFDLVHSNSVFEHLADVPKVAEETARVLKPGGLASLVIHLFPSLSGGHHLDWAFPDEEPSSRVPPWDHLRANLFPAHPHLNRWRERDFRGEFEKRFGIVEEEHYREGGALLTPEMERELPGYTREELLTRAWRVILRRKG